MDTTIKWDIVEVLCRGTQQRRNVVLNLLDLIEKQECTIPFIARYRRDRTGEMDPDNLRKFHKLLDELREVQKKSIKYVKMLQKQGNYDDQLAYSLLSAQSLEELEHLAPHVKGEKKSSLANKARALGLQDAATDLIRLREKANLRRWVNKEKEGLATLSEVENGVKNIVADLVAKDPATLENIRDMFREHVMSIECKLTKNAKNLMEGNNNKQDPKTSKKSCEDVMKFSRYFEFSCKIIHLKSYQALAINRAESLKYLTVTITILPYVEANFLKWCSRKWSVIEKRERSVMEKDNNDILYDAINESYKRLIRPFILRTVRKQITRQAHEDSVEVFTRNLKKLLLTAPVRGKVILGIDPGFKNGCKCAIISPIGSKILATDVFNLRNTNQAISKLKIHYENYKYDIIALGNGTACRETEMLVSDFIRKNGYNVQYCIVNESGASIYSVTKEAEIEMPDLDPNIRSAVSIARRLQDPLVEMVKIDTKNLGVGMYQHDIPPKQLSSALDVVVEECVTFVGVDLNIVTESMLQRVAGIKPAQAKKIIAWRDKNGSFICREELQNVKGIGEKTFQQCVGFLRINHNQDSSKVTTSDIPSESKKRKSTTKTKQPPIKKSKSSLQSNILDQTHIHPESYDTAIKLAGLLGYKVWELESNKFKDTISQISSDKICEFCADLQTDPATVDLIFDGFKQIGSNSDIRDNFSKALYRKGVSSIHDLRRGQVLTGRVSNVTTFGVFLDIGVGKDALSPAGKNRNWEQLRHEIGPNDTVSVTVCSVNVKSQRITLEIMDSSFNNVKLS